jgi:putative membrane protein
VAAGVGGFSLGLPTELWGIMLGGFIALSAMILPGISGSFLLLLFGLYEPVFGAIHELNWPIILAFAAGGVLGLASMARILNWAFKKKPAQVRSALVGLMLGSSIQLWPFNHAPAEGMNLVWAAIGVMVGGVVLWALERLAR